MIEQNKQKNHLPLVTNVKSVSDKEPLKKKRKKKRKEKERSVSDYNYSDEWRETPTGD